LTEPRFVDAAVLRERCDQCRVGASEHTGQIIGSQGRFASMEKSSATAVSL
jgi:hypothetical protein